MLQEQHKSPSCVLEALLGVTPEMESQIEADILERNASRKASTPLIQMPWGKSVLQDAFVRLQSIMAEIGLLPMSEFGLGRCSASDRAPCGWRQRERLPDRMIIRRFFEGHAHLAPDGAVCMEWDDVLYLKLLKQPGTGRPACHHSWALKFRFGTPLAVSRESNRIYGDLTKGASFLGNLSGAFHFIICNQVFEHVDQPFAAAKGLFGLTKPGGIVLFTVC